MGSSSKLLWPFLLYNYLLFTYLMNKLNRGLSCMRGFVLHNFAPYCPIGIPFLHAV